MGEEREGALIGRRLGTYDLLRLIGAGGMAEVYLAQDINLERQVAVKVLPHVLAADPAYVARFRDEARRVANLNHPHIVPVYTAGEQDGLLYMVMPFLPESLRDRIERAGRPTPAQAIGLVLQIADALAAAHQVGIIHRDVKPENILMDSEGHAVLTDFGVAREVRAPLVDGQRVTHISNGLPVGTPEYMAPEQFIGAKAGPQADIYALGTVLYELLVGYPPREADNPEGVISITLARRPVVPPAERNPAVWPSLNRAVMVALEYDPQNRYADMEQFRDALAWSLKFPDEPARPAHARGTIKLAAAPPTPRVPEAAEGHEGDRQVAGPTAPAWAAPYLHQVESDGWRRFWHTGLVALLLLGVAGASLAGILHMRESGQATAQSTLSAHDPGGPGGTATYGGTGVPTATDPLGVDVVPVATQQAATATAHSAPGPAATSTVPESPPTSTPVPPALTYNPESAKTGGPGTLYASASGVKQPICSASLTIRSSDSHSRAWAITSWQNATGVTAAWSYTVEDASGAVVLRTVSLPSGTIAPTSFETLTATFQQGPGASCSGLGFKLATATFEDEAIAAYYSFAIYSS